MHETFKRQGKEYTNGRVALAHQHSHASLASDYLRRLGLFDLSGIVQYHDEPFALYRKYLNKGSIDFNRIRKISVRDIGLYFKFVRLDSGTKGKQAMPDAQDFQDFITRMEEIIS